MKISADKALATIEVTGTYNAAQLEELMRKLAELRAQMTPAVAESRDELDSTLAVLVEENPALNIALRTNGGFRLWLRNRGYGWMAYEVDNKTAAGLHNYLGSRVLPTIDLINEQVGGRH